MRPEKGRGLFFKRKNENKKKGSRANFFDWLRFALPSIRPLAFASGRCPFSYFPFFFFGLLFGLIKVILLRFADILTFYGLIVLLSDFATS